MKKIFILIAMFMVCAMSFISCGNKNAINKKDLIGVYEVSVDVSSLPDEANNPFVAMFASMLKGTIEFQKDVMVSNFMGEIDTAEYKIVNDSVLYVKKDNDEYGESGVIRKIGDTYNNLQLVETDGPTLVLVRKTK